MKCWVCKKEITALITSHLFCGDCLTKNNDGALSRGYRKGRADGRESILKELEEKIKLRWKQTGGENGWGNWDDYIGGQWQTCDELIDWIAKKRGDADVQKTKI